MVKKALSNECTQNISVVRQVAGQNNIVPLSTEIKGNVTSLTHVSQLTYFKKKVAQCHEMIQRPIYNLCTCV